MKFDHSLTLSAGAGKTPEEEEVELKRKILADLEGTLAEKKLELNSLQAELECFLFEYQSRLGALHVEHDSMEAETAARQSAAKPDDSDLKEEARKAWSRAKETRESFEQFEREDEPPPPASKELKALWYRLCRENHPDTALDEADRVRRERNMRRINGAYALRDLDELKAIDAELGNAPEAIQGDDVGATLVRTIRLIHDLRRRIAAIDAEIIALKESPEWRLYARIKEAQDGGEDLLEIMEARLRSGIEGLRETVPN